MCTPKFYGLMSMHEDCIYTYTSCLLWLHHAVDLSSIHNFTILSKNYNQHSLADGLGFTDLGSPPSAYTLQVFLEIFRRERLTFKGGLFLGGYGSYNNFHIW